MQGQLSTKGLFQVALVTRRQRLGLGTVHHDHRRILPACVGITKFDPAAVHHRWWVGRHRVFQNACESGRTQGSRCGLVSRVDRAVKLAHARPVQGRDKVNVRVVNKLQSPSQL